MYTSTQSCCINRWIIHLLAYCLLGQCVFAQQLHNTNAQIDQERSSPSLSLNPREASALRGYVELTYSSSVDGTQQPYTLGIPDHYDSEEAWPIQVFLHGFGGTNQQGLIGRPCKHDYFKLYVHGRARGVAFMGLSEVDVLEAMEVVMAHWKIDRKRIHLMGGSMGGFGALRMGARFPDRFASLRVLAGSGLGRPLENLRHLPTRALHGDADHSVPICLGRGSINAIREFGGVALIDEFPGLGHGIPSAKRRPADEWSFGKKLSRDVKHIRYTATDEKARGAYWVKVVEWGSRGMPATINARIDAENTLHVELDNVTTAQLELKRAPINRDMPLRVIVNSALSTTLDAPVPKLIWVSAEGVSKTAPAIPKRRLHCPGGSFALYHGEPLLIVYGTDGDAGITERLRETAEVASRSADGKWPPPSEDLSRPTVFQMTTGRLPIKADSDVADEDIARFNLLLLGDAKQNRVVRRMADKLPVKLTGGAIRTDDGVSWEYADRGFGLLYANPLAPKRLIYWVAAEDPGFYRPGTVAPLSTMMDYQGSIEGPADFMIMDTAQKQLVAARRFDSRWNWIHSYKDSPVLDRSIAAGGPRAVEIADAIRCKVQADFGATTGRDWYSFTFETVPGVTREMDVATVYYGERIGLLELTGEQLLSADEAFRLRESKPGKSSSEWFQMSRFVPPLDEEKIDLRRTYRIAFPEWAAFTFGRYSGVPTNGLRLTDIYVRDAIDAHLKR